jgi:hypothetical protein
MRRGRVWASSVLLCLFLTACGGAAAPSEPPGPQAWIDAPLNGSSLPLGPVEVVSHAAAPSGVAQVEFSVNGVSVASEPPGNTTASLSTQIHTWQPAIPGNYTLGVRAQDHQGTWGVPAQAVITILGGSAPAETVPDEPGTTPTATARPACLDRARFVRETIPDNMAFAPGAAFTKIWRLRNDGDCTWGPGYGLVFVSGARMSGASPLPLGIRVAPGQEVDVSLPLVAPSGDGTYRGNWMLEDPQGQAFGIGDQADVPFWVQVVVSSAPTAAPDTRAPSVTINHSPAGASVPQGNISFTATASDNVRIARIEIWISFPRGGPQLVQTCQDSTGCTHTDYFSPGTVTYRARAYDAAGNMAESSPTTITIYIVVQ